MKHYYIILACLGLFITTKGFAQSEAKSVDYKAVAQEEWKDEVIRKIYEIPNSPFEQFKPENEVVEKRTKTAKTFSKDGENFTSVIGAGAVHYKDGDAWKTIVNQVVPNNSGVHGDYGYYNKWNHFHTYYGAQNQGIMLAFANGGNIGLWQNARMIWLDANGNEMRTTTPQTLDIRTNTPTVNGSKVTYQNAFEGIDAEIEQLGTGIESSFLIQNATSFANAPQNAEYLAFVEEINAQGLTLKEIHNEKGEVNQVALINAQGETVISYNVPHFWAKYNHSLNKEVYDTPKKITGTYKIQGNKLFLLVPTAWLLSPERAFPITIDPVINVYPQVSTAWSCTVNESNFGGDIWVGFEDGTFGNGYYQGAVEFDLTAIPDHTPNASTVVCDVDLNLYQNGYTAPDGANGNCGNCSGSNGQFRITRLDASVSTEVPNGNYGAINSSLNNPLFNYTGVFGWGAAGGFPANAAAGYRPPFQLNNQANIDVTDSLISNRISVGVKSVSQTNHADPGVLFFQCGFAYTCEDDDYLRFSGAQKSNEQPFLTITYQHISMVCGNGANGNPNDDWVTVGYNGNDLNLGAGTQLEGRYVTGGLNINTTNQWGAALSPSATTGWVGCTVNNDNHTVVHKRCGFPCGSYRIDVPTLDGSADIYVDGNLVASLNAAAASIWTGPMSQNTSVEIRHGSGAGNSDIAVNFVLTATWAADITYGGASVSAISLCSGAQLSLGGNVTGTLPCAPNCGATFAWTGCLINPSPYVGSNLGLNGLTTSCDYILTVTDEVGCVDRDTVQVTVVPIPSVLNLTPAVCSGSQGIVTIQPSAPGIAYSWFWALPAGVTANPSSGTAIPAMSALTNTGNSPENATLYIISNCFATPQSTNVSVIPTPVATANPAASTICSGGTTNISVSGNMAGETFSWNAGVYGSGYITTNPGTISFTANNNTNNAINIPITITPIMNGCSGTTINASVSVLPNIIVSVPNNISACVGSAASVNVTASPALGNYTYSWCVNGNCFASSNPISIPTSAAGNLSVTVMASINGCDGSTTANIQVNPIPVLDATPNPLVLCSGGSGTIDLSTTPVGNATYNWSYTTWTGANQSGTTNPINITLTNTDTIAHSFPINITGTLNGCSSSLTSTVTVNPAFTTSVLNALPNDTVCGNQSPIYLTLEKAFTNMTFTSNTPGVTVNGNIVTVPVSNTGTTTIAYPINIQLGLAGSNSCTGNFNTTVWVKPLPKVTVGNPQDYACSKDAINIPITSNLSGTLFQWTRDNGINVVGDSSGTVNSAVVGGINVALATVDTATMIKSVTFYIIPSYNGCAVEPITVGPVNIIPRPTIAIGSQPNPPYCDGQTITLIPSSNIPGTEYIWLNGNGSVTTTGNYCAKGYFANYEGCADTACKFIEFLPLPPVTASASDNTLCLGSTTFLNAPLGFSTYSWVINKPNGGVISCPACTQQFAYTPDEVGTYNFTVYATTSGGCTTASASETLVVDDLVAATFTYDPIIIHETEQVEFISGSFAGISGYSWGVNSKEEGTGPSFTYTFPTPGNYLVSLNVYNRACYADTAKLIQVIAWGEPFVPNVVTPNGDGYNDTWDIYFADLVDISLKVYDRWGQLVYSSKEAKQWNGDNMTGNNCNSGVYFYSFEGVRKMSGDKWQTKGNVTLLR
jgi:gliding motility-associated-like protein